MTGQFKFRIIDVKTVVLTSLPGNNIYHFNVSDFDHNELKEIRYGKFKCECCRKMPDAGFESDRDYWCPFAEKIARLQEAQIKDEVDVFE